MTYIARNTPNSQSDAPAAKEAGVAGVFWEQLSPRSALVVGLTTSILVLGTLGFIILLFVYFRGNLSA